MNFYIILLGILFAATSAIAVAGSSGTGGGGTVVGGELQDLDIHFGADKIEAKKLHNDPKKIVSDASGDAITNPDEADAGDGTAEAENP